jgi:hypothetical protein
VGDSFGLVRGEEERVGAATVRKPLAPAPVGFTPDTEAAVEAEAEAEEEEEEEEVEVGGVGGEGVGAMSGLSMDGARR